MWMFTDPRSMSARKPEDAASADPTEWERVTMVGDVVEKAAPDGPIVEMVDPVRVHEEAVGSAHGQGLA